MTRDKAFAEARKKWPFHPLADCWPLISEEDWPAFVADIKAHGQRQVVLTYNGQVVDGRNRLAACVALGIAPRATPIPRGVDPVALTVSLNDKRRHLGAAERAVCVDKALRIGRSDFGANLAPKSPKRGVSPAREEAKAHREAIQHTAGVSERTAKRAARIGREAPKAADQIAAGEKTVTQVEQEIKAAKQPKPKKTRAFVELAEAIVQVQQAGRAFRKAAGRGHRLITLTRRLEAFEAEVKKVRTWHPQKGTKCKHCGGRGTVPVSNGGRMECEQCLSGVAGV